MNPPHSPDQDSLLPCSVAITACSGKCKLQSASLPLSYSLPRTAPCLLGGDTQTSTAPLSPKPLCCGLCNPAQGKQASPHRFLKLILYLSNKYIHIIPRSERTGFMVGIYLNFKETDRSFPGGAVVENLPANAGDRGSSPGLGRSHMPRSSWAHEPQLLSLRVWSLCSATREAAIMRGPRIAMKSGPRFATTRESLRTETKTQHSRK